MLKSTKIFLPAALLALTSLLSTGVSASDGDAEAGKLKAISCLGCHAVPSSSNAYPAYNVPKVAGQHAAYIVSALKAYKDQARKHGTMQLNAEALTNY